jgi:hypothetical protein
MAGEGGGDRFSKHEKKKQDTSTSRHFKSGEKDKDSNTAELGKTPTKYQLGSPEWRLQQWSDFQDKSGTLSSGEAQRKADESGDQAIKTDAHDRPTEIKEFSSNETTKQNRIHEGHYRNYEDYNKILLRAKL